jgi:hypothetical protein
MGGRQNRDLAGTQQTTAVSPSKTNNPFPLQLLMDSIGGTSLTIMLTCISPAEGHIQESMRTLDYANRAKNVKNKPVVLLDPQQTMLQELKKEIDILRCEIFLSTSLSIHLSSRTSASLYLYVSPSLRTFLLYICMSLRLCVPFCSIFVCFSVFAYLCTFLLLPLSS